MDASLNRKMLFAMPSDDTRSWVALAQTAAFHVSVLTRFYESLKRGLETTAGTRYNTMTSIFPRS